MLLIILAISVSLDTLGIAMAYRMAGIIIPCRTRWLIAGMNGVFTFLAVLFGMLLGSNIPDVLFQLMGAGILVALGIKTLWNALGENKTADYDKDHSHTIDLREGCMIGVVFALDSISAGFGIATQEMGLFLFPICTAVLCYVFLAIGGWCFYDLRRFNGLSGVVLIVLGLLRMCPGIF